MPWSFIGFYVEVEISSGPELLNSSTESVGDPGYLMSEWCMSKPAVNESTTGVVVISCLLCAGVLEGISELQ